MGGGKGTDVSITENLLIYLYVCVFIAYLPLKKKKNKTSLLKV